MELKHCPFCGGNASLSHESKHGRLQIGSVVRCESCGIKGEWFEVSTRYASDEKAVEAWNRRADNG